MKKKSENTKVTADRLVKGIRRQTRKHYSAEEKIRIVLAGLRGEDEAIPAPLVRANIATIAAFCRREGLERFT